MKKLTILMLLIISSLAASATIKKDTTSVEFTDKGTKKRLTVYTNGKRDFQIPSTLNLDNLLREIGVDSSERRKAIVLVSQNGDKKDTILVITRDGRKIKIIANDAKGIFGRNSSKTDTLRQDEPYKRERRDRDEDRNSENRNDNDNNNNNDWRNRDRSKEHFFSRNDFSLYLGFNNWFSNNSAVAAPALSPLGSR